MLEGSPVRLVMMFSVPLIFSNIFQQLYYITDAVIVGNFIGIGALAAVNSCSWITWLLNAVARDLSNTLSILASYSVGENDREKLKVIVGNACTITVSMAVVLTVLAEYYLDEIFQLFQVQEDIIRMTGDYFSIVLLGIPLVLIYNVAAALLRASGNSRITFYAVSVSTAINVALDILFIVVFGWGVKGGALATVIAQFAAMLVALVPLWKSSMFTWEFSYWKLDGKLMKQVISLWIPMFVNSAVISVGGSFVSRNVNAIGPFFTAGISSATKIFTLMESLVMAIQTGLSVFIGQNLGAEKHERVRKGQHQIVLLSLALSVILNVIVQGLAPQLVNVFLSKTDTLYGETLHVAVAYVRVLTLGMFIMAPMYLYRIAIQTLGHVKYPMYAGFLQLAARIFSVLALPPLMGEYAYYIATILAWLVTLPVVVIPYCNYMNQLCREKRRASTADSKHT
ncbi:MATE family efflux transporter [Lacrimispora sp. 210928-DFI.3.58]|uniref:MATE family efflux transporter n=1 Tax=Lacrimispora sp. 210928-DFI.3.58 TaxID=2883214 RepID=UPI001D06A98B|nr:MATE family efflux transporter [Lacrimispora sp. 210928-DFI.3.58]